MLTSLCDGVWYATGPVSPLGMRLSVTMTVLRLDDGTLLVHSPLPWSDALRPELAALGPVAHLYAPNTFHHQWLGGFISAYPNARVHAPAELATKRPDLRIDRFHDQARSAELAGVDELPIRGFRLRETVLLHRASGTAIVADLVHNIGRPAHRWTQMYASAMGFYDRVALSRMLRWTAFDDRHAARQSIDAILGQSFDNLMVGHGTPIVHDARALLAAALAWLPSSQLRVQYGSKWSRIVSARPCG